MVKDEFKGVRKSIWFSTEQLVLMEELKKATNDTMSTIVRKALIKYANELGLNTVESK